MSLFTHKLQRVKEVRVHILQGEPEDRSLMDQQHTLEEEMKLRPSTPSCDWVTANNLRLVVTEAHSNLWSKLNDIQFMENALCFT